MAKTDYERYIQTDELFACLRPRDGLAAHDELLFQVTHQTAELWMKVIMHDVQGAIDQLDADCPQLAADLLARAALIESHLSAQLAILEKMPPKQYVYIRRTLGKGSGQESPGFHELLEIGNLLWPHVASFFERRQVTLLDVLHQPDDHYELHQLVRALMELDGEFRTWRFYHFRLVERQIGAFVDSLKGVPAELLTAGMREYLMPELWAAVNEFTRQVQAEEAKSPQDS